jgi:hypothetical protein
MNVLIDKKKRGNFLYSTSCLDKVWHLLFQNILSTDQMKTCISVTMKRGSSLVLLSQNHFMQWSAILNEQIYIKKWLQYS